jgi:hypothetical protein
MKMLGNIHSCDDKSYPYCCMQQPNQDDVEIEFLDEYQMPSHTMEVAAAPEICFRVGSAQLFAVKGGENFLKIVVIVF